VMVFLVESIEVGDLVLCVAPRGQQLLINSLYPDRDLPTERPAPLRTVR
jgi:hypothetical protein